MSESSHCEEAFRSSKFCLACPLKLEDDNDKIRRIFPCGHTMCGNCVEILGTGGRAVFCNYCGSCVIRRRVLRGEDDFGCIHSIRYLETRRQRSIEIPSGFFLRGQEAKMPEHCEPCFVRAMMREFTINIRSTAALVGGRLSRIPDAKHAFACCGKSSCAINGKPNGLPIGEKECILECLTNEAVTSTMAFQFLAEQTKGIGRNMENAIVIFRYALPDNDDTGSASSG